MLPNGAAAAFHCQLLALVPHNHILQVVLNPHGVFFSCLPTGMPVELPAAHLPPLGQAVGQLYRLQVMLSLPGTKNLQVLQPPRRNSSRKRRKVLKEGGK